MNLTTTRKHKVVAAALAAALSVSTVSAVNATGTAGATEPGPVIGTPIEGPIDQLGNNLNTNPYQPTTIRIGDTAKLNYTGGFPAGTRFELGELPFAGDATIDAESGTLTIIVDSDAVTDAYKVPVFVTYPGQTPKEIGAVVTVVEDYPAEDATTDVAAIVGWTVGAVALMLAAVGIGGFVVSSGLIPGLKIPGLKIPELKLPN